MLQVYDYLLSSYDGQVSSYPSSQLSTGGEIRIMMIRFRISSTLRIIGPTLPLRHTGSFTLPLEARSDPEGLEQFCQKEAEATERSPPQMSPVDPPEKNSSA